MADFNKILVNKIDKEKIGRKFLTQPKYTQIGIATAIKNSENYILIIFLSVTLMTGHALGATAKVCKNIAADLFDLF